MSYNYTIIVDSREQQPWNFKEHSVAVQKLDTGDYSIKGMENILCIERKKSVSEIAINITEKRFTNVIERMSKYPYAFMLLEFNLADVWSYPVGSDIPKRLWDKIRISPNFIMKHLLEFEIIHNISVIFCGNHSDAAQISLSIMNKVYELENKKNKYGL